MASLYLTLRLSFSGLIFVAYKLTCDISVAPARDCGNDMGCRIGRFHYDLLSQLGTSEDLIF